MNSTSYIAQNWYWMVAAAASGGLLLWQQIQGAAVSAGLSPAQAVQVINREKGQVIDVSEAAEYAAAHVVGAKNLPLSEIASGKGLPSNKKIPLVVVCATGARSGKAVAELKKLGHENVQPLGGGLKAWREANLPIEKA
ncbi:rhodanese-like domain-containing protein [Aquabacterium sp.]|jgi:rhodanese-related sulfurtransferase|uniref:rhodanese-like domain-containing protein n=1 Tax=Aquabacterium sp. TaxID=1872578 RepID=UPI0025B7E7A9|nr:rhodanese-like domain-containing protein [Aquabacterium sp.]